MNFEIKKWFRLILGSLIFLFNPVMASAALTLESVYPTVGLMGQNLKIALTGTDFDDTTRVSMSLDVGNKNAIIGSVDTPGSACDVAVIGDTAYIADGSSGLQIINISTAEQPELIGTVATPDDAFGVAVFGTNAYVAAGAGGLQIIDIHVPENPRIIGSMNISGSAKGIWVSDNTAYVAADSAGLYIIDISTPENPRIIGSVDTPGSAVAVTVAGNHAYVADYIDGLQVIDISTPEKPRIIAALATPYYTNDVVVAGNLAYVTDERSGLLVIDISNPEAPKRITSVGTPGNARKIFLLDDRAYVADTFGGLQIIDISTPENPKRIGFVGTPGSAMSVYADTDSAYVADFGEGLQVIDIRIPENPQIIGSVDTPNYAYDIAGSGNRVYVADGYSGGLQVIDITTPQNPRIIGSLDTPGSAISIRLAGNKAYIGGGYSGMQVVDISTPENPAIIGSVDTPGSAYGIALDADRAYVADWDGGLQIIDISTPEHPFIIGSIATPGYSASDVVIADDIAYVTEWYGGLCVIDICTPESPTIIGSMETPGISYSLALSGDTLYVADGTSGVQIVDVSIPATPQIIGSVDTTGSAGNIILSGNNAYVADGKSGIQVIDISTPKSPQIIGSVETPGNASGIIIRGDRFYVANGYSGMVIVPTPIKILPIVIENNTRLLLTLPSPEIPGNYVLRVFNENEHDELFSAVTFFLSENYMAQQKEKAIIIAGGGPYSGNGLWTQTQRCANYAYLSLLSQGYTKETVYFLSPKTDLDLDGNGLYDDVDKDLTTDNFFNAIIAWAKDANDVLLYMTDHGGNGSFLLNGVKNPPESLNAETLDTWLDSLQMVIPGRVIFIYDACRSGSFVPLLTPPAGKERILITSAQSDEPAWFLSDGALSFSYQLWASIFLNANLYDAYINAGQIMRHDQTALIDANGNGIPNEKKDQILAGELIIGRGRIAASLSPFIQSISNEMTLTGESAATLCAFNVKSMIGIERVWAVISPPENDDQNLDNPVTDLPFIDLTDPDHDGNYEGTYNKFTLKGTYGVTVFAEDTDGIFATPLQTTVNQLVGENTTATISGTVHVAVGGHNNITVINAVVSLVGTDYTTTTDNSGNFILENIPDSTYTLTINAPNCKPISQTVTINNGTSAVIDLDPMITGPFTTEDLDQAIKTTVEKWDINADNKKGIPEAIDALQTSAGIK